jgi:3',5'-cyclic AMP phosphodiesterase CpdA
MRTLVHLSDLHFGRVEANVLQPLSAMMWQIQPDLIVISGDLTQNATEREFLEVRKFLSTLPEPRLVVPGNHDMPFPNLFRRYMVGLDRYRRHISADLEPYWEDDELAVVGVNTARIHSLRGGSINSGQMERVRHRMCPSAAGKTRILVTHHPFDLPEPFGHRLLVRRSHKALESLAGCIDLLLAGHMHISHVGHTAARYKIQGQSAIFVQAGTATSTRNRGEPNAFNLIRIDRPNIDVERMTWNPEHQIFSVTMKDHFHQAPGGWARTARDPVENQDTETSELDEMTVISG